MIKIDEQRILSAYTAMNHVHGYIDGVREQVENFCEHARCHENLLEYVLNSYKYMQDWLESGIRELEDFAREDDEE